MAAPENAIEQDASLRKFLLTGGYIGTAVLEGSALVNVVLGNETVRENTASFIGGIVLGTVTEISRRLTYPDNHSKL